MRRLALDGTAEARESRSAEPDARAGAVILYTSGSSGQPKGVLYDHVSFLHTAMTYCHALGIDADDRIALVFTASAFGGICDILAAVLNGATLLPYDLRTRGVL
jgi:acyl-coenzyme A synthetase/AMP-(fatty) acid ligase